MKFYYNDTLIRTSKTHQYTHALINSKGAAVTCSATKEGCEQFRQRYISEQQQAIANFMNAIKALNVGSKGYFVKWGRQEHFRKFEADDTVTHYNEQIENANKQIEYYRTNWKIVELEERA